jgi:micrococcal nuclease
MELYTYLAKVISVHDGDTLTALVDLGFDVQLTLTIRLFGINAPELFKPTTEAGRKSRDFIISKVLNQQVVVQTLRDKKEKYGRYLAHVYYGDAQVCLNDELVANGLAVYQEY